MTRRFRPNELRGYGTSLLQADQPRARSEPRDRDLEPRTRLGIGLFALALLVACFARIVIEWYDDIREDIERERKERRDGE